MFVSVEHRRWWRFVFFFVRVCECEWSNQKISLKKYYPHESAYKKVNNRRIVSFFVHFSRRERRRRVKQRARGGGREKQTRGKAASNTHTKAKTMVRLSTSSSHAHTYTHNHLLTCSGSRLSYSFIIRVIIFS